MPVGKPQGRSLCVWGVASGSAASHPDPGSSGMVEFSEESRDFRLVFGAPTKALEQMDLAGLPEVAAVWSAPGAMGPRSGRPRFVSPHRPVLPGRGEVLVIARSFTGRCRFQDGLNLHEEVSSRAPVLPIPIWIMAAHSGSLAYLFSFDPASRTRRSRGLLGPAWQRVRTGAIDDARCQATSRPRGRRCAGGVDPGAGRSDARRTPARAARRGGCRS